jgi:hypothetical protein
MAVPMATRLGEIRYKGYYGDIANNGDLVARKFPSNQIHLSLSLPASLTAQSGPSIDPFSSKVLLVMEKKLGGWLSEVLEKEKT